VTDSKTLPDGCQEEEEGKSDSDSSDANDSVDAEEIVQKGKKKNLEEMRPKQPLCYVTNNRFHE